MTTTTQGLTSPHRHTFPVQHPGLETALAYLALLLRPIAEPVVKAISPHRIGRTIRVLTALVATLTIVGLLTACDPVETTPGRDVTPSAGVVIPGQPPVPTTTWELVGA